MQLSIIAFFICAAVAIEDKPLKAAIENIMPNVQKCIQDSGVDMEVLMKTKQGIFEDDPKLKAAYLCLNKKMGIMDQNGEWQIEVIKKQLDKVLDDQKQAAQLLDKCIVKKDTPEDTAFEAAKCAHQYLPQGNKHAFIQS